MITIQLYFKTDSNTVEYLYFKNIKESVDASELVALANKIIELNIHGPKDGTAFVGFDHATKTTTVTENII